MEKKTVWVLARANGLKSLGKLSDACREHYQVPRAKKVALVAGLAERIGLTLAKKMERRADPKQDSELCKKVKVFYMRHDISYTMP